MVAEDFPPIALGRAQILLVQPSYVILVGTARGHLRGLAAAEREIGFEKLPVYALKAPAIQNGVVKAHQQPISRGREPDQGDPQQRRLFDIEADLSVRLAK